MLGTRHGLLGLCRLRSLVKLSVPVAAALRMTAAPVQRKACAAGAALALGSTHVAVCMFADDEVDYDEFLDSPKSAAGFPAAAVASAEESVEENAAEETAVEESAAEEDDDEEDDDEEDDGGGFDDDGSFDDDGGGFDDDGSFDDDGGGFDEDGGEDAFTSPLAAAQPAPLELWVGGQCEHNFLGKGMLLAIGATESVADGVLKDGQEFSTLEVRPDQVLFCFEKREKCGPKKRSWRMVTKTRPVFASAVSMLPVENVGVENEPIAPSAFDGMAAAALEDHAFTAGLSGPELAAHERKRKLSRLKDAAVRGHNKAQRKTPEPKLPAAQRVAEFPDQTLKADPTCLITGLRCLCCKQGDISKRLSSIQAHVNGGDHKKKLTRFIEANVEDKSISDLMKTFMKDNPDSVVQATIPLDTHVYRWRVMEGMMFAGVPYAKIDMLRHLLEREGHPLTDSSNLAKLYIPQIEDREIKRIVKELFEQHFTLIFDGTTRLGEAVNMVTRSITDDFIIRMRLVAFKTTKVHMDGDALFRLIVTTLQRVLGLDLDYCVAYARDSCSTNYNAVNRLMPLSVNALNMLCFPHTLHNTGKHLQLPVLDEFMTPWLQLVPQPGAAKLRWQAILGKGVSSYSKVRWWSRWEIMQEIALNFGALLGFLTNLDADGIGDATTKKMLAIVTNQRQELELELAAVMSCERLCLATYRMEGDRLELLLIHHTIEELIQFGHNLGKDASDLPSVAALLRNRAIDLNTKTREWFPAPHNKWFAGKVTRLLITTGAAARRKSTYKVTYSDGTSIEQDEQELRNNIDVLEMPEWQTAVNVVKGAYDYLEQRITDDCQVPYHCSGPYEVCRVSQLFDPSFAVTKLTAAFVDELCAAIPALANCAAALKAETQAYQVAAGTAPALDHSDVSAFSTAVLQFWREHGKKMPAWRKAAKIVFAIPPNSAASERVFSLLATMFGKDQDNSLSDLIQAALMLRYNGRKVG